MVSSAQLPPVLRVGWFHSWLMSYMIARTGWTPIAFTFLKQAMSNDSRNSQLSRKQPPIRVTFPSFKYSSESIVQSCKKLLNPICSTEDNKPTMFYPQQKIWWKAEEQLISRVPTYSSLAERRGTKRRSRLFDDTQFGNVRKPPQNGWGSSSLFG